MVAWVNKLKQLLIGYLSTHDHKYIITDEGKKIIALNARFRNKTKAPSSF
jgi:hypothetical protein